MCTRLNCTDSRHYTRMQLHCAVPLFDSLTVDQIALLVAVISKLPLVFTVNVELVGETVCSGSGELRC